MTYPKRGFVLIPNRAVLRDVVTLSDSITDSELKLDELHRKPHLTVLQTVFRAGFDYNAALSSLRNYSGFKFEPRTLMGDITQQSITTHSNITWLNVQNAEWLRTFNRELIERLETWILPPDDTENHDFRNEAAFESYNRTGYEHNLDAYEPHITLAVTKEPTDLSKVVKPFNKTDRVRFHELAFVEHGVYGEITRTLASVSLPVSWD